MSKELTKGAGRFLGHGIAILVGLALMFTGVAMGVSLVLLPLGIPLGLVGFFAFLWGLFGWSQGGPSRAATRPESER
jgi:hypothetical protein